MLFLNQFVADLSLRLQVKKFRKSVNILGSYGQEFSVLFFDSGFYIAYVIHYGVLVSRCGWERITWRQNRVAVGRSAPSASTASGASSRCRAPSGTASRRRTASRSGRGRRCVTGTRAARTRHRVTSATWPQPPACPRHKSATGSRTGASETAPHSLSARASLTHPNTVFAVYRFYTIPTINAPCVQNFCRVCERSAHKPCRFSF